MNDRGWKILFAVAALYNFAAGLPPLLAPEQALTMFGMAAQANYFFVQLSGAIIATFGIFYALVAVDLSRREIPAVGIVGKLAAFALVLIYFVNGQVAIAPFILGIGDVVFVLFFAWFLLGGRKAGASSAK